MTTTVDTCIFPTWIVTVNRTNTVLNDHCVVIDKGKIKAILPAHKARQRYLAEEEYSLNNQVLIPGLINLHTHAAMTLFRGLADDLPLMAWLKDHIWPAESRWVDSQFVKDGTQLAIAEMIRSGTTCFNDMYFFPSQTARVATASGIRATVGLIVLDFPTVWANDANDYLAKGIELHDELRNNPLVSTAFAPHAPYTVSAKPLQKIAAYSDELDIPVHIHVNETAEEVSQFVSQHGVRPLQRLDELGLLSPHLLAVHMVHLQDDEIARIAESGGHILHCPESNMKLANGFCPIKRLLAVKCNITLGTDGAASNNDLDMLSEMRTAALIAKGASGDACVFSATDVLRAATINGARALGLEDKIGSIEVGKEADITVIDFNSPALQPVYDPISHIIYSASRDDVSHVWVAGQCLLRKKELTQINSDDAIHAAQQWGNKIASTR